MTFLKTWLLCILSMPLCFGDSHLCPKVHTCIVEKEGRALNYAAHTEVSQGQRPDYGVCNVGSLLFPVVLSPFTAYCLPDFKYSVPSILSFILWNTCIRAPRKLHLLFQWVFILKRMKAFAPVRGILDLLDKAGRDLYQSGGLHFTPETLRLRDTFLFFSYN